MKQNYVIIDDDQNSVLETRAIAAGFQDLLYVGTANNYDDGLNLILEHNPQIVFLEINPKNADSRLSLQLINELHRYLQIIPKIIVTAKNSDYAMDAIRHEVLDYYSKPFSTADLRKTLLRYHKSIEARHDFSNAVAGNSASIEETISFEIPENEHEGDKVENIAAGELLQESLINEFTVTESPTLEVLIKPLIICVKSYGDYRFIEAKNICYLQADNNSTDIHLSNGEMITAFKTLKHFETILNAPFFRIHNSYIANIDYITRIHTGNAVCYMKNSNSTKLPFSKSYRENVDAILECIANGNYIEI